MQQRRVAGVLGPTNTGKTHYAIERMLAHRTGIIGLPLRLLAREVYDKIVALRGPSVVALVTGEERIVPPRVQYWVCTVEAMPIEIGTDFVAIDEIQLCADPERGHVFTQRLLHMRGLHETLLLGSDTMRGPICDLVPEAQFVIRDRMSKLTYSGPKKISRMPARSAIVGFSVDSVYAMAELLRRQKGGAAVVLGALSPRTRNAQVELYQNGDVDYLVATDAIGMGLNLDVHHIAFSALSKFDGRRVRPLAPNELAQIAGRAGRGMSNGTFGVTGEAPDLNEGVVNAIVNHRFTRIKRLQWRNEKLSFVSLAALIASLSQAPDRDVFVKAREADDLRTLKSLSENSEIVDRVGDLASLKLLWDVCRIPDFRGISHGEHANLLCNIFIHIHESGKIPDAWLARQINFVDRVDGDIDAISKRLAFIRTWTYVSQRSNWIEDEKHWRETTRSVEDKLSDALHGALTKRFVDRRTSVLLRRLKQKEALLAEVNDKGEVSVEGEFVGRLEGFRFMLDKSATGQEAATVKMAAAQALLPYLKLRADRFYNAPDTEIDFTDQGGLMWGEHAIGKLAATDNIRKPGIVVFVDDTAGADVTQKVERRLQHFIDRRIAKLFEPLTNLEKDEALTGLSRGLGYQLIQAMGVLPRVSVANDVKALDQDARALLRKHGVRFGQFTVFMPALLKPAPTRLRILLWSLSQNLDEFPSSPPPGLVTIPMDVNAPQGFDTVAGFRSANARAIRIDMLERLADLIRTQDARLGFEATPDMLSITGMTLEQFADLMDGLGYRVERAEREKGQPISTTPVNTQEAIETETKQENDQVVIETDSLQNSDAATESADAATAEEAPIAVSAGEAQEISEIHEASSPDTAVMETYFVFTRASRNSAGRDLGKLAGRKAEGQKQGQRRRNKPKQYRDNKPKTHKPKLEKKKEIDPDNPFAAALRGLKIRE